MPPTDQIVFYACIDGKEDVVEFLLDNYANIDEQNARTLQGAGQVPHAIAHINRARTHTHTLTPLHSHTPTVWLAAQNGHHHAVRVLGHRGAKLELPDKSGNLACHIAAMHGHSKVLSVLARFKADLQGTGMCYLALRVSQAPCASPSSSLMTSRGTLFRHHPQLPIVTESRLCSWRLNTAKPRRSKRFLNFEWTSILGDRLTGGRPFGLLSSLVIANARNCCEIWGPLRCPGVPPASHETFPGPLSV